MDLKNLGWQCRKLPYTNLSEPCYGVFSRIFWQNKLIKLEKYSWRIQHQSTMYIDYETTYSIYFVIHFWLKLNEKVRTSNGKWDCSKARWSSEEIQISLSVMCHVFVKSNQRWWEFHAMESKWRLCLTFRVSKDYDRKMYKIIYNQYNFQRI